MRASAFAAHLFLDGARHPAARLELAKGSGTRHQGNSHSSWPLPRHRTSASRERIWEDRPMDGPHVICIGPEFGEGPVWCPPGAGADGGNPCVHERGGGQRSGASGPIRAAARWSPTPAAARTAPRSQPTAASSSPRTAGIDFSIFEIFGESAAAALRAVGTAARRARRHRQLPDPRHAADANDLCVAPDGTVYFTDPQWPTPDPPSGACSRSIPTARSGRRRRVLGAERHRARHRRRDAHRGGERSPR